MHSPFKIPEESLGLSVKAFERSAAHEKVINRHIGSHSQFVLKHARFEIRDVW